MTTERIQVLDYVTVDGVTLAPSGNPHTVSASTAALLIAARKALPYSKPPRLMPLYVAVITSADLPGFVGQPGVVYELDQPPLHLAPLERLGAGRDHHRAHHRHASDARPASAR